MILHYNTNTIQYKYNTNTNNFKMIFVWQPYKYLKKIICATIIHHKTHYLKVFEASLGLENQP